MNPNNGDSRSSRCPESPSPNKGLATILFGMMGFLFLMWPVPGLADEAATDAGITHWVKDAIRNDPRIDGTDIRVMTTHGLVNLAGSVTSLAAKQYADLEARKIHGVVGVINDLLLFPTGIPDAAVEEQIRRRIVHSAVIKSQGIQVKVVNGTARLTGTVATWTQGQEAELLAGETRGVTEVKNDITVDLPAKRNDREIQADVTAALARNVYLTGLPIMVTVQDGTVTLSGSIGNGYETTKAKKIAGRIAGVQAVRNHLTVQEAINAGVRKASPPLSNELVLEHVRAELQQDSRINATDITVEGAYGHITLDGFVNGLFEKHLTEQDVREVVGVGWVTNNLAIHGPQYEDWAIADNVEYVLKTDFALQSAGFTARTRNGIVVLSGKTRTWWQRVHAEHVASKVPGVKEMIDRIELVDAVPFSDSALTKTIQGRLKWNWVTHGFNDEVRVAVRNGVATLTGAVEKWSQREEAGTVAYKTQGIWLVDNQITVNHYQYPWKEWGYDGKYHSNPPAEFHAVYDMGW